MLPKQPINATAQLCYSRTPTTSFIVNAEGKATSPKSEPHHQGGSHIAEGGATSPRRGNPRQTIKKPWGKCQLITKNVQPISVPEKC